MRGTHWRCRPVEPSVPACVIGKVRRPDLVRHSWTACAEGWRAGLFTLADGICGNDGSRVADLVTAAVPRPNLDELSDIFWPNDPELSGERVDFAA